MIKLLYIFFSLLILSGCSSDLPYKQPVPTAWLIKQSDEYCPGKMKERYTKLLIKNKKFIATLVTVCVDTNSYTYHNDEYVWGDIDFLEKYENE